MGVQVSAHHAQKRPQVRSAPARPVLQLGHCRQSFRPRTAKHLQQEGFTLVVLLVGRQNKIRGQPGKNVLTFPPRSRFDTGRIITRNLHAMNHQFDSMRFTEACAESRPVVGVG